MSFVQLYSLTGLNTVPPMDALERQPQSPQLRGCNLELPVDDGSDLPTREKSSSSIKSLPTPTNRVSVAVAVTADFHKVSHNAIADDESLQGWRKEVVRVSKGTAMTALMACVILIDMIATMVDIDARAIKQETPIFALVVSEVCLSIYTIELVVIFAARRCRAFRDYAVLFDIFTVLCGFTASCVRILDLPDGYDFMYDLKV